MRNGKRALIFKAKVQRGALLEDIFRHQFPLCAIFVQHMNGYVIWMDILKSVLSKQNFKIINNFYFVNFK